MSTEPTRREATHDRIVEVAARTLRRNGYAGVGVADVMKQAGLTHGGFYAHFESRDALLAEAIERAGRDSGAAMSKRLDASRARGESGLRAVVDNYLSDAHLSGTEHGCVVAALSSEMPRQSPAL
ncbi:MAG: TetR/AcrR family transcriptional regulator, partial [Rhizobacter sp.]